MPKVFSFGRLVSGQLLFVIHQLCTDHVRLGLQQPDFAVTGQQELHTSIYSHLYRYIDNALTPVRSKFTTRVTFLKLDSDGSNA
jgi:hypothetical protein